MELLFHIFEDMTVLILLHKASLIDLPSTDKIPTTLSIYKQAFSPDTVTGIEIRR